MQTDLQGDGYKAAGYRRLVALRGDLPSGMASAGAQRSYGRHVTSVERILVAEEDRRLAYTVVGGIPVRNYRADVTLTPDGDGTRIRWAASWDPTLAGRIVLRGLRRFYPEIIAGLAAAAAAATPPPTPEKR